MSSCLIPIPYRKQRPGGGIVLTWRSRRTPEDHTPWSCVSLAREWAFELLPAGFYRYYPAERFWVVNPELLRLLGCRSLMEFGDLTPSIQALSGRDRMWPGAVGSGKRIPCPVDWPTFSGAWTELIELSRPVTLRSGTLLRWEGVLVRTTEASRLPAGLACDGITTVFRRVGIRVIPAGERWCGELQEDAIGCGPLSCCAEPGLSTGGAAGRALAEIRENLAAWSQSGAPEEILRPINKLLIRRAGFEIRPGSRGAMVQGGLSLSRAEWCVLLLSVAQGLAMRWRSWRSGIREFSIRFLSSQTRGSVRLRVFARGCRQAAGSYSLSANSILEDMKRPIPKLPCVEFAQEALQISAGV